MLTFQFMTIIFFALAFSCLMASSHQGLHRSGETEAIAYVTQLGS